MHPGYLYRVVAPLLSLSIVFAFRPVGRGERWSDILSAS